MARQTVLSRFHITKSGAFKAFDAVCRELRSVGLMPRGGELEGVCCEWHPVEIGGFGVTGFGLSDFTTEGYYWNRTIHIPAWGAWFGNCEGIRNVVRHEFGHAVADIYREKMRRAVFLRAFGGPCGKRSIRKFKRNWVENCVSSYAATNTEEDWAETFMLFIQNKGRLPIRYQGLPRIEAKWKAVKAILDAIARK